LFFIIYLLPKTFSTPTTRVRGRHTRSRHLVSIVSQG
jgi:hypothetical protein